MVWIAGEWMLVNGIRLSPEPVNRFIFIFISIFISIKNTTVIIITSSTAQGGGGSFRIGNL